MLLLRSQLQSDEIEAVMSGGSSDGETNHLYYNSTIDSDQREHSIYDLRENDLSNRSIINLALFSALFQFLFLERQLIPLQDGRHRHLFWLDDILYTRHRDADVMKCLRMLTFLPLDQINEMSAWEGSDLNRAKEILAWELTALVHGEEEANKAQNSARALFVGGAADGGAPVVEVTAADLSDDGITLPALLVLAGLCKSRSDARTNIQQGGVSIDGVTEQNFGRTFHEDELKKGFLLRRGKKAYKRIILK